MRSALTFLFVLCLSGVVVRGQGNAVTFDNQLGGRDGRTNDSPATAEADDWRTNLQAFAAGIERVANDATKDTVQRALTRAFPDGTKVRWTGTLLETPNPQEAQVYCLVWIDLPLSGKPVLGHKVGSNSRRLGVEARTDLAGIKGLKKGDTVELTTTLQTNMAMGGLPPVFLAFWKADGRSTGKVDFMVSLSVLQSIGKVKSGKMPTP